MVNRTGIAHKSFRVALRLSWLMVVCLVLFGSFSPGYASIPLGQGTVIQVDAPGEMGDIKQNNDGLCTLREAIIAANSDKKSGGKDGECEAGNGADTIVLMPGIYKLSRTDNGKEDAASTGDLDIFSEVAITGQGAGQTIIDASEISDRAFEVLVGGKLTLKNLTITRNNEPFSGDGGGIYNAGNLTLNNVTVKDNPASGNGGGIFNQGVLLVSQSTISGNTAGYGGGIVNVSSGSVTLNNSTISGNTAVNSGGGIENNGILIVNNVTIAENEASSGNGLASSGAANVRNTIITGKDTPVCSGTLTSQGYNLTTDNSCFPGGGSDEVVTIDELRLGPLASEDGKPETHALLPGSRAIDAGDPDGCYGSGGLLAFDERDEPRPVDGDFNGSLRCDIGAFEVGRLGLTLIRAFANNNDGSTIHGYFDGASGTTLTIEFFAADSYDDCQNRIGSLLPGVGDVSTDKNGYFVAQLETPIPPDTFVNAKVGDRKQSNCVPYSDAPNDSWPFAVELTPLPAGETGYIDGPGQSRWYKFEVEPNSSLTIDLIGVEDPDVLPADYDLTLYKDLQAAFDSITDPANDIVRLSAEYAGSSYSGSSYSGSSYSGSSYSGSSYSGSSYSGSSYSGSSYSGSSYSGSSYSGSSYSGSSYSGDAYLGSSYSGSSYSGSSYSGSSYSGSSYSEQVFGGSSYSEAYSDAQERSLLAVSAISGTAPETIFVRTWNSNEYYYVRIRSSNGEFSLDEPFRLEIEADGSDCSRVSSLSELSGDQPLTPAGNPTTLIVYDSSRLYLVEGSDQIDLVAKLSQLAAVVDGQLLDVNNDRRVQAANLQADEYPQCPYAKNVVAEAIKEIIDGYRTLDDSNLQYVVFVGGDVVIPFFRHPDNADLARESQFVPPVRDDSASQAALRLGYILSQDFYIAEKEVALTNNTFPIPAAGLSAGRLVETAAEISAVIDAFINGGGPLQPQSALVTGYDFLEDAALEIRDQLAAGIGNTPDQLITPFDVPPTGPDAWTASQLRDALLTKRHDVIFLAGHFSGHSALAADYTTELFAAEVAESAVDLTNSLIFSIGCHAGYNIVNQHEVPEIERNPDWAQAFARKGATLVAGTGYQYGETLTKEYSERLYIEFSKQLRRDTGAPVSIGHALNEAKRAYLTQIPQVRGLHEKVLLQTTIFGLPMLEIDMTGERFNPPSEASIVSPESLEFVTTNPGEALGLAYTDIEVTSPNEVQRVTLTDITDPDNPVDRPAEYLTGSDGLVTFPTEPFLPLEIRNVTVADTVLRGVGFRGGTYTDIFNILPVTGAPTTEAIALHLSWQTPFLHPIQMWNTDYLGALIDGQQRVLFTPAQHVTGDEQDRVRKSHRRQFGDMDFRLYYSNVFTDVGGHIPALSAPPSIIRVEAIPRDQEVIFRANVVGDPAVGIHEVWVTWTDTGTSCPCKWQPLDLIQRTTDTTLWEGLLPLNGRDPNNIRFMVQAANGAGRVARLMNDGYYFTPGLNGEANVVTQLTVDPVPSQGSFGYPATFRATLTTIAGQPIAGQPVDFRLGPSLHARGVTDGNGQVVVTINLLSEPGPTKLYAAFDSVAPYKSSSAVSDFTIYPQTPTLEVTGGFAFAGQDSGIVATLKDESGDPMRERGVLLVVTAPDNPTTPLFSVAGITDLFGQISLGVVDLPPGDYKVTVYFNDSGNPLTRLNSDAFNGVNATSTLTIIESPCETATARLYDPDDPTSIPQSVWEPNGEFWSVDVVVTSGNVTINSVYQDEPVKNDADARFIDGDSDSVELSAEREGNGDGRVYHIGFSVDAGQGLTCDGELLVPVVEHDQSGEISGDPADFDGGALYDSTIAPKSDPVANDDPVSTDEDSPVSGNVLANDDPGKPNDILTISAINGLTGTVGSPLTLASGAAVTLTVDGSFSYDPSGQFESLAGGAVMSDSFSYTLSDEDGASDTAIVTVAVLGLNDAPVALDDPADLNTSASPEVTIAVAGNDTDVDSALNLSSLKVMSDTISGTVTSNGDGTITYAPPAGFTGQERFFYEICDVEDACDNAAVTVNVTAVNRPPVANDDTASLDTSVGLEVTIAVAANDTDADGDRDLVLSSVTVTSPPISGTATSNGDGTITYTPNDAGVVGQDSFVYEICDAERACDSATVTVNLTASGNRSPIAVDDSPEKAPQGTSLAIDVLANDEDPDGDTLTVSEVTQGSRGSVIPNPDGTVTYTPSSNFKGEDSFSYTVIDNRGGMDTATVTVMFGGK